MAKHLKSETIATYARIRPLNPALNESVHLTARAEGNTILHKTKTKRNGEQTETEHAYNFTQVFDMKDDTETVFNEAVKPLLDERILNGVNSIFIVKPQRAKIDKKQHIARITKLESKIEKLERKANKLKSELKTECHEHEAKHECKELLLECVSLYKQVSDAEEQKAKWKATDSDTIAVNTVNTAKVRRVFDKCDERRNGSLDHDQLQLALEELQQPESIQALFIGYHPDKNGKIEVDFTQFKRMLDASLCIKSVQKKFGDALHKTANRYLDDFNDAQIVENGKEFEPECDDEKEQIERQNCGDYTEDDDDDEEETKPTQRRNSRMGAKLSKIGDYLDSLI